MTRTNFTLRSALGSALLVFTLAATGPMVARAAPPAQPGSAIVKVGKTPLGDVLVGSNNRTLYAFKLDTTPGESACYDQCAVNWPPLLTDGAPVAGAGVNAELLGTITRRDGKSQVTYNGMPLYYWAQDRRAGDVRGQGVRDVWYVVKPDGSMNTSLIARVQVARTLLGNILVGPNGLTLYAFKNDKPNESTCYDQCAANWPPLLTEVKPIADAGINARLLSTTERADGKLQVTYNGMPLYYWVNDKAPGDLLGQGVRNVWYVVAPNGRMITRPVPVVAALAIGNTELGEILTDAKGMTLYAFKNDKPGVSACYDQCATNWPPLLTEARPVAGQGVNAGLLGTTRRRDGKLQVTYNRMPLYYFARDAAAGETNGQGINNVWFVVNAAGEMVGAPSAAAAQPAGVRVALGNTSLGSILVGPNGLTLYAFTRDQPGESVCYEGCADIWPPLLTEGQPVAGEGVNAGLLGTTRRQDGKLQVTYKGMPLYYWVNDKSPGDVSGQGVNNVWFVVNAAGDLIR